MPDPRPASYRPTVPETAQLHIDMAAFLQKYFQFGQTNPDELRFDSYYTAYFTGLANLADHLGNMEDFATNARALRDAIITHGTIVIVLGS